MNDCVSEVAEVEVVGARVRARAFFGQRLKMLMWPDRSVLRGVRQGAKEREGSGVRVAIGSRSDDCVKIERLFRLLGCAALAVGGPARLAGSAESGWLRPAFLFFSSSLFSLSVFFINSNLF